VGSGGVRPKGFFILCSPAVEGKKKRGGEGVGMPFSLRWGRREKTALYQKNIVAHLGRPLKRSGKKERAASSFAII